MKIKVKQTIFLKWKKKINITEFKKVTKKTVLSDIKNSEHVARDSSSNNFIIFNDLDIKYIKKQFNNIIIVCTIIGIFILFFNRYFIQFLYFIEWFFKYFLITFLFQAIMYLDNIKFMNYYVVKIFAEGQQTHEWIVFYFIYYLKCFCCTGVFAITIYTNYCVKLAGKMCVYRDRLNRIR